MGTLSHAISARVSGYSDLPNFPETAPDPSVRNVEIITETTKTEKRSDSTPRSSKTRKAGQQKKQQSEKFYSDDDDQEEDQKSISTGMLILSKLRV